MTRSALRRLGLKGLALILFTMLTALTPCSGQTQVSVKLTAADTTGGQQFGNPVAVYGDTMIIGAPGDATGGDASGAAYIFERAGGVWTEQIKLIKDTPVSFDLFGQAVATNGETVVVGALGDNEVSTSAGAVYVYRKVSGVWTFQDQLLASDAETFDNFGSSLAMSGTTLVVGAEGDDTACPADPFCNSGAAYVFEEIGGTWTEDDKLVPSDTEEDDFFGRVVATDATTIVVGAEEEDESGSNAGAAYVFENDGGGWMEAEKLLADDGTMDDNFGVAVAVAGTTVVVGARRDDDGGNASGSAYVFDQIGGLWTQSQKLTASDASIADNFGSAVSMQANTISIGAPSDDHSGFNGAGSVYRFILTGSTWAEEQKLIAADSRDNQLFGSSVALDGDELAIGAFGDDDVGAESGAVYLFVGTIFSDGFESGDTTAWSSSVP